MANLLRHCLFGLLLVPALSFAQRTIVVEPGQVTRMYEPGQGAHAYFDSRNWNQPVSTQHGTINVPVKASRGLSWDNFRARASSILKVNPSSIAGGAAVAAALAAVDWLLDPDTNTLNRRNPTDTAPVEDAYWCFASATNSCPTTGPSVNHVKAPTLHELIAIRCGAGYTCSYELYQSGLSGNMYWSDGTYLPVSFRGSCPSGYSFNTSRLGCVSNEQALIPVTPQDIDNFTAGWSDPALPLELAPSLQVPPDGFDPDIFTGPSSMPGPTTSSTTSTASGDTIVSQDSITYNFDYSSNPLSITTNTTTVNNTYTNGTLTSTTTTTTNNTNTNTDTNVQLPDIPTDCEFMPTVCEWLDWTKQDLDEPDPDLSGLLNDEDFDRDFSIPLNASCPAPYPINTQLFGTVYFQWEPLCLFAEYIRYLVLSGAILFAMYISLGIQRKG